MFGVCALAARPTEHGIVKRPAGCLCRVCVTLSTGTVLLSPTPFWNQYTAVLETTCSKSSSTDLDFGFRQPKDVTFRVNWCFVVINLVTPEDATRFEFQQLTYQTSQKDIPIQLCFQRLASTGCTDGPVLVRRTRTHQQMHPPQRCGRSRIDDWRHLRAVDCWFHGTTCPTQHSIPHVCTVFSDSQKCCSSLTSSTMYPTKRTAECPNTLKIYVLANRIIRLHQTIRLPTHVFLAIFQTERCSAKRDPMCFQMPFPSPSAVVRN